MRKSVFALLAVTLLLGGCSGGWSLRNPFAARATASAPAVPVDPVLAAAGEAVPGSLVRTVAADGAAVSVQVERSYFAASGRECREVSTLSSRAIAERRVLCRTGAGWAWSGPIAPEPPPASRAIR